MHVPRPILPATEAGSLGLRAVQRFVISSVDLQAIRDRGLRQRKLLLYSKTAKF
ncbi:MAG: hypothetical protein PHF57_13910 [Methanoregula sp.]|nr:hypothetical protein [Methanoregula sp.]